MINGIDCTTLLLLIQIIHGIISYLCFVQCFLIHLWYLCLVYKRKKKVRWRFCLLGMIFTWIEEKQTTFWYSNHMNLTEKKHVTLCGHFSNFNWVVYRLLSRNGIGFGNIINPLEIVILARKNNVKKEYVFCCHPKAKDWGHWNHDKIPMASNLVTHCSQQ